MSNSRPWKRAQRHRVPFTVLFDLGDGLQAQYDALIEDIAAAIESSERENPEKDPKVVALRKRQRELNDQMSEAEWSGEFQAMPGLKWDAFVAEHPPREDNNGDTLFGCNVDTAFPEAVRQSLVEELSDEDWAEITDLLTAGDWYRLGRQVFELNARSAVRPKLPNLSTGTGRRS